MTFDQGALDAASREVHMMLLREGSSWGTKACEEMGRVFMAAYQNALPSQSEADQRNAVLDEVDVMICKHVVATQDQADLLNYVVREIRAMKRRSDKEESK